MNRPLLGPYFRQEVRTGSNDRKQVLWVLLSNRTASCLLTLFYLSVWNRSLKSLSRYICLDLDLVNKSLPVRLFFSTCCRGHNCGSRWTFREEPLNHTRSNVYARHVEAITAQSCPREYIPVTNIARYRNARFLRALFSCAVCVQRPLILTHVRIGEITAHLGRLT